MPFELLSARSTMTSLTNWEYYDTTSTLPTAQGGARRNMHTLFNTGRRETRRAHSLQHRQAREATSTLPSTQGGRETQWAHSLKHREALWPNTSLNTYQSTLPSTQSTLSATMMKETTSARSRNANTPTDCQQQRQTLLIITNLKHSDGFRHARSLGREDAKQIDLTRCAG